MDKTDKLGDSTIMMARLLAAAGVLLLILVGQADASGNTGNGDWTDALHARLTQVDAAYTGDLGVFVKDLDSGESLSFRGEEFWYLASGIKVPVAIAVMRGIERGEWSLHTRMTLEESDYVDGAGQTNWHPPGTELTVEFLLEQALIFSDNTASDMLIRLVGVDAVNDITRELVPEGFGVITTLADVRRHAYSELHPGAFSLSGRDFFTLREQRDELRRLEALARLLEVTAASFALSDLDSAFDAYYATRLNSARLSAFGALLQSLAEGEALQPEGTRHLMQLLYGVVTGDNRIKAGLGESARFAHKTGTQRSRACDLGVATVAGDDTRPRRLVIAACSRGSLSVAESERALRAVGQAVRDSGVLDRGVARNGR